MSNLFKNYVTVKINCHGGILTTGTLSVLLDILKGLGIQQLKFGLRQCMYVDVNKTLMSDFQFRIEKTNIPIELDAEQWPNVMSSYPAEEIFTTNTWLSEGVYKDILDSMDFRPRLKINLCDYRQSFTPLFTGNINWIASDTAPHFWHLYLRFPKTNTIYTWNEMVYTNDIMRCSRTLDDYLTTHPGSNPDQGHLVAAFLIEQMQRQDWITREKGNVLTLPSFTLPYYEGFNRYNDRYWLGIYRRDESYSVNFLEDLCTQCQDSRIGQICTTPWKSIIIKGIEEKDKLKWNQLLARHTINVRHALNELNFQVEDLSQDGLELKKYLVNHFNNDDIRTFGICFGIKTRQKSEIYSSILIRKRYLIHWFNVKLIPVFDILVSKDFNPNERTEYLFSEGLFWYLLPDQLLLCIAAYYRSLTLQDSNKGPLKQLSKVPSAGEQMIEYVFQCKHCFTHADPESENFIINPDGSVESGYLCSVCDSDGSSFGKIEKSTLELHPG